MCDFLPMSVHAILNDVETSLSLPVLIIIVLCILQFVLYYSIHLACTLRKMLCSQCDKKRKQKGQKGGSCIMRHLKALFFFLIGSSCNTMEKMSRKSNKSKTNCKRSCSNQLKSNDNDWDDNDDDDDDE